MIHQWQREKKEKEQRLNFNREELEIWIYTDVNPDIIFKNMSGERSQKVNTATFYSAQSCLHHLLTWISLMDGKVLESYSTPTLKGHRFSCNLTEQNAATEAEDMDQTHKINV